MQVDVTALENFLRFEDDQGNVFILSEPVGGISAAVNPAAVNIFTADRCSNLQLILPWAFLVL